VATHIKDVGRLRLQCIQQCMSADQEDAGIPEILAINQKLHCFVSGRLFNKAIDLKAPVNCLHTFPYVAISGTRMRGHDTKSD